MGQCPFSARGLLGRGMRTAMAVLLAAAFAQSQSISGRIVGTITDATGAVVPRATIEITNEGTGAARHLVADDAGNYVAAGLPVGFYIVKIEAPSLAASIQKHVKV